MIDIIRMVSWELTQHTGIDHFGKIIIPILFASVLFKLSVPWKTNKFPTVESSYQKKPFRIEYD